MYDPNTSEMETFAVIVLSSLSQMPEIANIFMKGFPKMMTKNTQATKMLPSVGFKSNNIQHPTDMW